MSWAGAVTSVVGGLLGNRAADAQGDAAEASMDWIRQVYGDAQGNLSPYMGLGGSGVNGLQALLGGDLSGFWNSPDNVAQREAMNYGMDHSAAARGRLFSGGYGADLSKAQGDLASQQLGNYRNSLMGLAQMGQQSALGLGQLGAGTMGPMSQAYGAQGQAQANGLGAIYGGIAGLGNAWGQQQGGGGSSSYGGGSSAGNYGLPAPNPPSNWWDGSWGNGGNGGY
jgi:hypothetical protein